MHGEVGEHVVQEADAGGNGMGACSVKVDAPDIHEASALFREKWPVIESMARDGIKTGTVDDGVITLVVA